MKKKIKNALFYCALNHLYQVDNLTSYINYNTQCALFWDTINFNKVSVCFFFFKDAMIFTMTYILFHSGTHAICSRCHVLLIIFDFSIEGAPESHYFGFERQPTLGSYCWCTHCTRWIKGIAKWIK